MYIAARSGEIAPIITIPNETAGFIWAPCYRRWCWLLLVVCFVDSRKKSEKQKSTNIKMLNRARERENKRSIHIYEAKTIHAPYSIWVEMCSFVHWNISVGALQTDAYVIGDDFQLENEIISVQLRSVCVCVCVWQGNSYPVQPTFDTSSLFSWCVCGSWSEFFMYTKYLVNYRFVLFKKKKRPKSRMKKGREKFPQEESAIREKKIPESLW